MMGRKVRNKTIEVSTNVFNEFITTPKPWEYKSVLPMAPNTGERFRIHKFSYDTLFRAINKMKTYKSHGTENIGSKVIKQTH